jgi:putative DNA primase/helicase
MDFVDFARCHGLLIDRLEEGRWMRVPTENHPRKRNGAYKFLGDVGFVQDHATMDEVAVWKSDRPATVAEQRDRALRAAQYNARDLERRLSAQQSMREAYHLMPMFAGGHPYLQDKGLSVRGCSGLKLNGDLLVIPVTRAGKVISYQTIAKDGEKKFRFGCPVKQGFYLIERKGSSVTCFVEGFATGLAVFQALPQSSVVVCFNAGNLIDVARDYPVRGMAVVCADNDWVTQARTGTNPGLQKGTEAAELLGCGVAYPEKIDGTDWADFLMEEGSEAIPKMRTQILRHARLARRRA